MDKIVVVLKYENDTWSAKFTDEQIKKFNLPHVTVFEYTCHAVVGKLLTRSNVLTYQIEK